MLNYFPLPEVASPVFQFSDIHYGVGETYEGKDVEQKLGNECRLSPYTVDENEKVTTETYLWKITVLVNVKYGICRRVSGKLSTKIFSKKLLLINWSNP